MEVDEPSTTKTEIHAGQALVNNKSFMDIFWQLADPDSSIKVTAVITLTNVLKQKQREIPVENGLSKETEYAISRLVKGLMSGRKHARQGFLLALNQVLKSELVDVEQVLEAFKDYKKKLKGSTKQEHRNATIGEMVMYLAFIRSDHLHKAEGSVLEMITKRLLNPKERPHTSSLNMMCLHAVIDLMKKVSSKKFSKHMWPLLEETLSCGWQECTRDELALLMACQKHHPKTVTSSFLSTHWQIKEICSENNLKNIVKVVLTSLGDHTLSHPLWDELLRSVIDRDNSYFEAFWKMVVSEGLVCSASAENQCTGLEILIQCVRSCTTKERTTVMFADKVVEKWLHILKHKSDYLHEYAVSLVSQVIEVVKERPPVVQKTIVKVLFSSSELVVSNKLHSKLMTGLLQCLSEKATKEMAKFFMELVVQKNSKSSREGDTETCWAIGQLRTMLTNVSTNDTHEWHVYIIKFLFLHSYFEIKEVNSKVDHCEVKPNQNWTEAEKKMLHDSFWKALNCLASFNAEKERAKDPEIFAVIMHEICQYAQVLSSAPYVSPTHETWTKTVQDRWLHILSTVKATQNSKSSKVSHLLAFKVLFLSLGLQLFEDMKFPLPLLEDLQVCYESVGSKDSDNDWLSVLVEILVSLLSRDSYHLRIISSKVFYMLAPNMSQKALNIVIQALVPDEENEEQIDFEDSDNEDNSDEGSDEGELDVNQSLNEVQGVNGAEESSSEDSEQDDEDEAEGLELSDVDESFRMKIETALGDTVAKEQDDSSDKEESDSEMDDDQMFGVDKALAEVFKMKSQGQKGSEIRKEQKKQILSFKLRCLDLIDNFIKVSSDASLLMDLIEPLLRLVETGVRDREQKILGEKATGVLNHLVKTKKVSLTSETEKSRIALLLKSLIQLSVTAVPLLKQISAACCFLLKIILGNEEEFNSESSSHQVMEVLSEQLQDYFEKRDSRLNILLFHNVFERYPAITWPLYEMLINYAADSKIRIFRRTQAVTLISYLVKGNVVNKLIAKQKDAFKEAVVSFVKQYFNSLDVNEVKQKFLLEVLIVLHKFLTLFPQAISESIFTQLSELRGNLNKDGKRMVNRILALQRPSLKRQPTETGNDNGDLTVKSPKKKKVA